MLDHPLLSEAAQHGVRLGLNRMRSFLTALGSPHLAVPVVHVAGTNGKGSVVRMVSEILRAHGLRTGELSSPHLQAVNERIRVDGAPVSDETLDRLLWELADARTRWAADERVDQGDSLLTYFELTTAAGFLHLAQEQVDVAVVEVGLGGRLDATNLVQPVVTGIVSISIDHAAELGPDIASIAAEKGGIIKTGVPVVLGPLLPAAYKVIRAMAADRRAPLLAPDDGYRVHAERGSPPRVRFSLPPVELAGLELSLSGQHQLDNAGVALALSQLFLDRRLQPPQALQPEATAQGLAAVRHAGRLEWLASDLLVDGAHNPAGASALAAYLRALPRDRPRTLLLGVSQDKDVRSVVVALEGVVDRVITTHCSHPRAMAAGQLAEALVGVTVPVLPAGPVEEALPLARSRGDLVVAAGSLFLVGAVRELSGVR